MSDILSDCAKRWNLRQLTPLFRRPEKAVYSAESPELGAVILKIDSDRQQLYKEHEMLIRMGAPESCRVWDYCPEDGCMLLERILPGTPLRAVSCPTQRVQAFCAVFDRIHTPADAGKTYLDWLDGICQSCETLPAAAPFREDAQKARTICREMFEKYPQWFWLHGDLHHDNLLLRTDGSYAAIDPKGIIGPAILEIPRFLLNEPASDVAETLSLLSAALGYPESDLQKLLYMETVLANVWCIEDGIAPIFPLTRTQNIQGATF